MIKVKTKVSGCFRTEEGARDYLKIMSYVGTAHKQGYNAYEAIKNAITGHPDFIFEYSWFLYIRVWFVHCWKIEIELNYHNLQDNAYCRSSTISRGWNETLHGALHSKDRTVNVGNVLAKQNRRKLQ